MAASYIAIIVCSLLGPALAQGVNLSAEIWAVVGVAAGVVIIIVAFIWIIFCVMLYRHQKEREDDEDHEVKQNMNEIRKKRKRRQRREESRENELPTTSTESGYVQYPTSEDLWNSSDDIQRQDTIPPAAQLSDINADTLSPDTPPTSPPTSAPQPVPPTTSEPADLTPVPSPMATKPYTPVPEIFESIFTPPTNASEEEDHRRGLHVRLSANVSTSRLRKLSDVEECEVQPDVSNFPLRYGQRRISSTARPVSDYGSSDPFSFSFGPPLLGRNRSQKEEVINGTSEFEKRPRHITDHKDIMFGQLCSWPEFNNY